MIKIVEDSKFYCPGIKTLTKIGMVQGMRCFLIFEDEKILMLTTKTTINNRLPIVYVVCNKKDNI